MTATISFHGPYEYRVRHHPAGTLENHPEEYGSFTIKDPQGNVVTLYFGSGEEVRALLETVAPFRDMFTAPAPAAAQDAPAEPAPEPPGRAPLCPAETPTPSDNAVFKCTLDAGHGGMHEAGGTGNPGIRWAEPPAPTCLSCGATGNLTVRHVPARTGIAPRDEHYCEDLAACAGRRAAHLTATTGGAS